jgi:hypothetical protein
MKDTFSKNVARPLKKLHRKIVLVKQVPGEGSNKSVYSLENQEEEN